MKVSILAIFLLHIAGIYCIQQIKVKMGDPVTLACSTTPTQECSLLKNNKKVGDGFKQRRYNVVNASSCIFEATDLNFTDNGQYNCETDSDNVEFLLLVTVTPDDPVLRYSGEFLKNDSVEAVDISTDGIRLECWSNNSFPKSNIKWFIDGEEQLQAHGHVHVGKGGLLNTKSMLFVNVSEFYNSTDGNLEDKVVTCTVSSSAYNDGETRTALATFQEQDATTNVTLTVDSNENKITCTANGFPEPDDFQVLQQTSDGKWVVVSSTRVKNVRETGIYVCEARNSNRGTKLTDYVRSAPTSIELPIGKSALGVGIIVAIVVGSLLLLVIVVLLGCYVCCREKLPCESDKSEGKKRKSSLTGVKYEGETEKMRGSEKKTEEALHSEI